MPPEAAMAVPDQEDESIDDGWEDVESPENTEGDLNQEFTFTVPLPAVLETAAVLAEKKTYPAAFNVRSQDMHKVRYARSCPEGDGSLGGPGK